MPNKEGKIFGRINVIDFIVLMICIVGISAGIFAKTTFRNRPEPEPITTYRITRTCPNCGLSIPIEIDKGKLIPKQTEPIICERCGNEIVLIKHIGEPQPPNYSQMFYEFLYKNRESILEKIKELP